MYNIILTDGKTIKLSATKCKRSSLSSTVTFFDQDKIIGEINMDNIAGWMEEDHVKDTGFISMY